MALVLLHQLVKFGSMKLKSIYQFLSIGFLSITLWPVLVDLLIGRVLEDALKVGRSVSDGEN